MEAITLQPFAYIVFIILFIAYLIYNYYNLNIYKKMVALKPALIDNDEKLVSKTKFALECGDIDFKNESAKIFYQYIDKINTDKNIDYLEIYEKIKNILEEIIKDKDKNKEDKEFLAYKLIESYINDYAMKEKINIINLFGDKKSINMNLKN